MHEEATYVRTCLEAGARGYLLKNAMDLELVSAVKKAAAGERVIDPRLGRLAEDSEPAPSLTTRELEVLQLIVHGKSNKDIATVLGLSANTIAVHRANIMRRAGNSQYRGVGRLRHPQGTGQYRVRRVADLLLGGIPLLGLAAEVSRKADPGFRLADVTAAAGIDFHHNSGAFGAKYLPETLGPGCAFIDYDADGWLDILLVNGTGWPGHNRKSRQRSLSIGTIATGRLPM